MSDDNDQATWVKVQLPTKIHRQLKMKAVELDTTVQALVIATLVESIQPGSDTQLPRDRRKKSDA